MIAQLMKSLHVGDVLSIPMPHLGTTLKSVILRIDEGGFYPSWPQEKIFVSCPLVFSPYRWSDEEHAVVDCDNEVPPWYSRDVTVEQNANLVTPAEYERILRKKDVRIHVSNEELKAFYERHSSKFLNDVQLMYFILRNHVYARESGSDANAAGLLLQAAGIKEYDKNALCMLAMLVNELRMAWKRNQQMFMVVPMEGMREEFANQFHDPANTQKGRLH